ncbi:MAG: DNA polymerase III subunit gamma/tau [Parvularcula sp.]
MSDPENAPEYLVLARKYRPQNFDDLLGHEAMVRTLRNAFAADRIAHAFILTGVRGVGKTTTARIMARALNYETDTVSAPTVDMPEEGRHCRAIAESRHPDVIEMDAASRTGVGDIRELIEGVRYAPVEGRYKVYIIDEVHMLSTNAFNALLKTLEEPPPHVKFIFATTEIRKVPVTVLSRCQRFDLKRFDVETLSDYLRSIAEKEGAELDSEALAMLARAAEGSVRDGLSLLDQAIIQHSGEPVDAVSVRDMLGLADRTQSWALLEAALTGKSQQMLELFREQYNSGAAPDAVLRDLLELTHLLTRIKAAGEEAAAHGPAGDADRDRALAMAAGLSLPALTRTWSLLMKALEETQTAPDPAAAAEIGLIRIAYAAGLPTPTDALRVLGEGKHPNGGARAGGPSPSPTGGGVSAVASGGTTSALIPQTAEPQATDPQTAPRAMDLTDIVAMAVAHRDAGLRLQIEAHVLPVRVEEGRLEIALKPDAPEGFVGKLTRSLQTWTGTRWGVSVVADPGGLETLKEKRTALIRENEMVKAALETFPDAKIIGVRDFDETNRNRKSEQDT